jgi:predicted nucleic acid-binding protein
MARTTRIYLDACALLRLFDRSNQARVLAESQAVEEFLALAVQGKLRWVISEALAAEIANNPDPAMRTEVLQLLSLSAESILLSDSAFQRAEALERLGYGAFDALHLAGAEQAKVDSLLTTDDRFIRRVRRGLGNPVIPVENPVKWRREFAP